MRDMNECMGCAACMNACPKHAIRMKADGKGFLFPDIDSDRCVNCGICDQVCIREYQVSDSEVNKMYAVKLKDETVRIKSASGAAFMALSGAVLNNSGVVAGAAYQDNLKIVHCLADNQEDVKKFQGSKYPQSEIGFVFQDIKNILKSGQLVLFSGTPCQVDGLKRFLHSDYNNLITCDIICHGVMSPKVYQDYINMFAQKGQQIQTISFRDKEFGWSAQRWSLQTKCGKKITGHQVKQFKRLYTRNFSLRNSCYLCRYANKERVSDITIGDCWALLNTNDPFIDNIGVSSVWIHTEKGMRLFDAIQDTAEWRECTFSEINQPQLNNSTTRPDKVSDFWNDYEKRGIQTCLRKYGGLKLIEKIGSRLKAK